MHKSSRLKPYIGTIGIKFRIEVTSGEGIVDPRRTYLDLNYSYNILFFRMKSEANCYNLIGGYMGIYYSILYDSVKTFLNCKDHFLNKEKGSSVDHSLPED